MNRSGEIKRTIPFLALCLGLLFLPGCLTAGPNFQPPQPQIPEAWSQTPASVSPTSTASGELSQWWTIFNDPLLVSLVERSVQANLDLRQAELRIRQARAALTMSNAGRGPTADLSAAASRSQASGGDPGSLYRAGFDASWELDLFGGIKRGTEAAEADLEVAEENRRQLQVSLAAEVAIGYMEVRGVQEQLLITRKNLATQQHSADLVQLQFKSGLIGGLDSARAQADTASAAARIPPLESALNQAIQGLGILLALEPGALFNELLPSGDTVPEALLAAPIGLPAELLRRRPDIRAAEAQIHAATARIGVAEADLFPKVTLNGSLGLQDQELGSLLDWGRRVWSLGPSVNWRLFDLGRVRASFALQENLQEQSALAYQQTILKALLEVENALTAATLEQRHRQALLTVLAANRQTLKLSSQLYAAGQIDFLAVLDAQRSLYASEDALAQSTKASATYLIALYKGLGGGWEK